MKILKAYGLPPRLLISIIKLYENTKARVRTPDGDTELFLILAGVLQGDTFLFVTVVDCIMRQTIANNEKRLGFQLTRRQSRRVPAKTIIDLDFADDIALVSENNQQAQELLLRLENEANKIGLHLNSKKTKFMSFNQSNNFDLKTKTGSIIEKVDNFKYLGAWMENTEKDINVRKALVWNACHKLKKIWNSSLSHNIKVRLFTSTVESILLYASETWTLTKNLERQLDGCYTRMLRMALIISWKRHLTNRELYRGLPTVPEKIRKRRLRLAGHCVRHQEEIASDLVLWQPADGQTNRGRPKMTFIKVLLNNTGLETTQELKTCMMNRAQWKNIVEALVRSDDRPR